MKYRREIDGLRAVAVLPVIFFHAGFEAFEGGFVGVDVFFVISGYLITTIILSDMNNEKFSIVTFYERRARRILPALFFVMVCCLPFAWLWLLPSHLKDFGQSLIGVSGFSSNILFWRESGYFGVASELKPLLHTWSLAVEEQYYILFPLFLMALWKLRKRWIFGALMVVGAISLCVAQWGAYYKPSATFFLLPTRGWELAIGALIAFYFLYKKEHADFVASRKKTSEVFGVVGLTLIAYSIFAFDKTTPFPSLYALIPTVGTAFIIIFANSGTAVGRFLSLKPLVGIGLISYSTYLWHQPLFVFARHRSLTEPGTTILLVLSAMSILLAYISWRFVEGPFRDKKAVSRKAVFTFAFVGSLAFAATGLAGHLSNGFDTRTNAKGVALIDIDKKVANNHGLNRECDETFTLSYNCRTSDEPEVLLWGDSYAMHLAQGIISSNPAVKMIQMTKSGCGPFLGVAPVIQGFSKKWPESCLEFNNSVFEWLKTNKTIKYVVVSSLFTPYLDGNSVLIDGVLQEAKRELSTQYFLSTLSRLKSMGITPVVFSPPPKSGNDIGECLVKHDFYGMELSGCDFNKREIHRESIEVHNFLNEVSNDYKVVFLDEGICSDEVCETNVDSMFLYRDEGHLSHDGSAFLGKKIGFYDLITHNSEVKGL